MLDPKYVREHIDEVKRMLEQRKMEVDLSAFEEVDQRRRDTLKEVEALRALRNTVTQEIALLKKAGEDASEKIRQMKDVSEKTKGLETKLQEDEFAYQELLLELPNVPHTSVTVGEGDQDNPEIRRWGEVPEFSFPLKPHWEIGEDLGILDFSSAAKITGARFALLKAAGARLERALINFMLDLHIKDHDYCEVLPPFLVNRATMTGTGQLPKFESDLFAIRDPEYFLIPTAEVPVANIHQDEILDEADLPISYVSYTPCFRREAGSYGKDTRGLIRQHQFNKVELVKFVTPDSSYDQLESLTSDAEAVLQKLGLPYRVVSLCTGDLGFAAAKTYDIEVWIPFQKTYREISSCSNCEDFQARRASIRYRPGGKGKPAFVHTLNGSGLAVGRTMVAILECFQQEDGSVVIPEALRPYLDGMERIKAPS